MGSTRYKGEEKEEDGGSSNCTYRYVGGAGRFLQLRALVAAHRQCRLFRYFVFSGCCVLCRKNVLF